METNDSLAGELAGARARLGEKEYARRTTELRAQFARDDAAAKITRARKIIGARRAAAVALAEALESIARLTWELEKANADLTALELTHEQRAALGSQLRKLPADVRVVLQGDLPNEVRQVDAGKFQAQLESVHAALIAAIESNA